MVREVRVKSAPVIEPVDKDDVKAHLRIDFTNEDDLIESYITAAREYIETTLTKRALITQTLELTLDHFPGAPYILELAQPPFQEVVSIKYVPQDGDPEAPEEVPATDYLVDLLNGRIVPAVGKSWPTEKLYPFNGVIVEYKAGYGDAGTDVPKPLTQAMLLMVGEFYRNREHSLVGTILTRLPFNVQALTAPYRVEWF